MKRIFILISAIFCLFLNSGVYGSIKVGLDSGHSIKELHKSGGAFDVKVFNEETGQEEPQPYYAVGWSRTNLFS